MKPLLILIALLPLLSYAISPSFIMEKVAEQTSIRVLPNFANNFIDIQFLPTEEFFGANTIEIFNEQGKSVHFESTIDDHTRISTAYYPKGIYYIMYLSNATSKTTQFEITK